MRNNKTSDTGPVKGRVFSYLRWSSDRQSWGDSERRQNEAAEAWCARQGLSLAGQAKDEGVSAFTGKNRRQGSALDSLLKTVSAGDILLLEDNDRFSREDTVTALSSLREIVRKGVTVVFLKTGVEVRADNFNDPSVLFANFFQSYLGHAESAKKSVRVKASWDARKAALKKGTPMNQNLPSWLRWNSETKQVLVIDERAEIVRRMFKLYLETRSIRRVTRQFITEGIPCISKRKGSRWTNTYIHHTLTNRSVIGDCLHTNPPTPNIFPAIVAEKDFYAVAERLKVGRHFTAAARKRDANLFVGLAVCSKCGRPMNKNTYRRPSGQRSYLVCGAGLHDSSDCGLAGVRYEVFEKSFAFMLTHSVRVREALTQDGSSPSQLALFQGQLGTVQNRANKLLTELREDDNPSRRVILART